MKKISFPFDKLKEDCSVVIQVEESKVEKPFSETSSYKQLPKKHQVIYYSGVAFEKETNLKWEYNLTALPTPQLNTVRNRILYNLSSVMVTFKTGHGSEDVNFYKMQEFKSSPVIVELFQPSITTSLVTSASSVLLSFCLFFFLHKFVSRKLDNLNALLGKQGSEKDKKESKTEKEEAGVKIFSSKGKNIKRFTRDKDKTNKDMSF